MRFFFFSPAEIAASNAGKGLYVSGKAGNVVYVARTAQRGTA